MAIEFIGISDGKTLLKGRPSVNDEITEEGVKTKVIDYTLKVLRGQPVGEGDKAKKVDLEQVIKQAEGNTKVWVLTLKYGVVPVSMAKITSNTENEAKAEAIKYVEGLKTKMTVQVTNQFRAVFVNKKASIVKTSQKAKERRDKERAKIAAMSETEKVAYLAEKKEARKRKKKAA